ncbi:MAG: exopolyphosphatase [Spirochaetaceae bacterium]|nr:MAG: exopolyphosphatase [Spirochaetaceae bacterium]
MASSERKFRLVTRSDFDGLVCAVLLRERDMIDEIKFVHPKDMQDGLIAISGDDITTNLPYVEGVHLAFDHHFSETLRVGQVDNYICDPDAPSAARVVFRHYGGREGFPNVSLDMLEAVDKGDSADFTRDEVLDPEGWNLLNFIMDARTGLGRFRNFRISNYQLMMDLIDYCKDHDIDDILLLPDVAERVELYEDHKERFRQQMLSVGQQQGNVLLVDLRSQETIYAGNRFVKYALFPEANVSVQVLWGFKRQNTVLTVGKSIFNRSCKTNIGELMLSYGGGGHAAAGTCQVPNEDAERVVQEVLTALAE